MDTTRIIIRYIEHIKGWKEIKPKGLCQYPYVMDIEKIPFIIYVDIKNEKGKTLVYFPISEEEKYCYKEEIKELIPSSVAPSSAQAQRWAKKYCTSKTLRFKAPNYQIIKTF